MQKAMRFSYGKILAPNGESHSMDGPMPLYLRALQKYQEDGFVSLVAAGKNMIMPNIVEEIGEEMTRKLSLHRNQMTSQAVNEGSIWYYGSETEFDISAPVTTSTSPEFNSYLGTHSVPQQFVCEISNAKLTGKYALPLTQNGRFVLEEMGDVRTIRRLLRKTGGLGHRIILESISASRTDIKNPEYDVILNLVPRHFGGPEHEDHANYGHWLAEDLPRLRGYHRYQEATGRTPTILIKQNPPGWMIETLNLLGFSSSDWVEWDGDSAIASRLVVPQLNTYDSIGTAFDPQGRKWVSQEMKQRINMSDANDFPDRIFTSRQGQSREIINYDEIRRVLNEFDIAPVQPENMSIDNQIQLFSQADVIVGPFGANLTNIIFSEDSTVVEIFPNNDIRPVFYITANEQGLDYDYVVGEPDPTIDNRNILVNTNKLEETLSNTLL